MMYRNLDLIYKNISFNNKLYEELFLKMEKSIDGLEKFNENLNELAKGAKIK